MKSPQMYYRNKDPNEWSLLIIAVALVVIFIFLTGCMTVPGAASSQSPIYKLDLFGELDGVPWSEGIAVGSSAPSHTIQIESKTDVNLMRIISCHRFESFPDAIKTGWFRPNRGFEYDFNEAPGIEDNGVCLLRLQAFTKELKSDGSPVGSAYGIMLFHNNNFTLPAENICNGADGQTTGTSICQSMNGLVQRIRFKTQVIVADDPPDGSNIPKACKGTFVDAYTFQYETPLGECVAVFASLSTPHQYAIHAVYGFSNDQYRSE